MKTLVEYIKEACEDKSCESKTFNFNFKGFEGEEDFLKSVEGLEGVEVEEDTVKVTVSKDFDTDKAFELIQDYLHLRDNDTKKASDESYAQKLHKLMDKLTEWRDFVDDLEMGEEEPKEDDSKEDKEDKEDKKEEDSKEDKEDKKEEE